MGLLGSLFVRFLVCLVLLSELLLSKLDSDEEEDVPLLLELVVGEPFVSDPSDSSDLQPLDTILHRPYLQAVVVSHICPLLHHRRLWHVPCLPPLACPSKVIRPTFSLFSAFVFGAYRALCFSTIQAPTSIVSGPKSRWMSCK